MKVLHLIDNMDLGGAQFLIKGIFEKSQNSEFYLFVLRTTETKIPVNHPNVIYSKSTKKYSLTALFELRRIIKKHKIDALHAYLLKSQIFAYFLKLFSYRKIKFVFHEVGEVFMNNTFIFKTFLKLSEKKANLYLATSESTKKALVKKGKINKSKIITLYNYINLEKFSRSNLIINIKKEKQKLMLDEKSVIIGYAGRLSKEKGCEYLIQSIPYIKNDIKLLIAGKGNEESKLKNLVKKLNLESKVHFLGFVSDVLSFYPLIDVLVIPSEYESFGLVAVEAQALKIPVIASDIPGLNEVVIDKKTGLLFEAKNPKSLANKINLLISNEQLKQELTKQGYENAQQYNIDTYYDKLMESYKLILNE